MKRFFACAVMVAWAACSAACQTATTPAWVSTTAAEPWKQQPQPKLEAAATAADVVIETQKPLQTMEGFGGCFNELGWKVLLELPEAQRTKVVRALYADEGCGFTLARMPIGASDYAREWYSLDEAAGDLALQDFSIERDRGYLLKYVKAAMDVRPELGVWISAWSPPSWMKDNNRYNSGHLKTDAATRKAYANYLAKAVQAYQGEGLKVYAVVPQNEPRSDSRYPTCVWDGPQMRDFIRDYMGPVFRAQKVKADIWLGTLNDGELERHTIPVMSDPAAAAFITGITYQWEGKGIIAEAHKRWPNVKLIQSESECRSGANSFADAEYTFGLVRRYLNGGASSYFSWNMVLQPGGRSTWNWVQNALITVDPEKKTVVYNPEFYLMKHVSHFVRPGFRLTTSTGELAEKLAFVGPDGTAVLLIGNPTTSEKMVTIGTDKGAGVIRATLASHSLNTLVIPAGR